MCLHIPTFKLPRRHDPAFQGATYWGLPGTDSSELSVTVVLFVHYHFSDS